MGRRSKFSPELVTTLTDALSVGMTDQDACLIAGISKETFYLWQRTKSDFLHDIMRARSMGWMHDMVLIKRAGDDGDWRAAAEHLDRSRSPYRKSVDVNLNVQIRKRAEQLAEQIGIPVDEFMAEVETVAAGAWDTWSSDQ